MERRMMGNCHVRCEAGEKLEIISNPYLSHPEWVIATLLKLNRDAIHKFLVLPKKRWKNGDITLKF